MENLTFFERINKWARRSITLKLISIGILVLILLIPTSMLTSLVYERQNLRDNTIEEVSSKWGDSQTIGGPVISIPYTTQVKTDNGKTETEIRYAHFLPEEIQINGSINPEKRYRGIYVVVLYNTHLHVSGKFNFPSLKALNIPESEYSFNNAVMSIGISDMKGITEAINFKMNDSVYSFDPGVPTNDIYNSGASFKVNLQKQTEYKFEFDISLNGSSSLQFLPFGKVTRVTLQSSWDSPSFEGSFLPANRKVTKDGFTANWKVLHLNRNYPQQGLGSFISQKSVKEEPEQYSKDYSSFGVKLLLPIDEYKKTLRSVKYCSMFIIITFLAFFFVEVLNKKRIHFIQYLLVGFAVCLFYVLLLSITEHLKFDLAYLIACIGILALITFYAKNVFKNTRLTVIFSSLLALLYGFFYSLLQLEDYALLLGSVGLFLILATIMYLTRHIDWIKMNSED